MIAFHNYNISELSATINDEFESNLQVINKLMLLSNEVDLYKFGNINYYTFIGNDDLSELFVFVEFEYADVDINNDNTLKITRYYDA